MKPRSRVLKVISGFAILCAPLGAGWSNDPLNTTYDNTQSVPITFNRSSGVEEFDFGFGWFGDGDSDGQYGEPTDNLNVEDQELDVTLTYDSSPYPYANITFTYPGGGWQVSPNPAPVFTYISDHAGCVKETNATDYDGLNREHRTELCIILP